MSKNEDGGEITRKSALSELRSALSDASLAMAEARTLGGALLEKIKSVKLKKTTFLRTDIIVAYVPENCINMQSAMKWFEEENRWPSENAVTDTEWRMVGEEPCADAAR